MKELSTPKQIRFTIRRKFNDSDQNEQEVFEVILDNGNFFTGSLPSEHSLFELYDEWKESYQNLSSSNRGREIETSSGNDKPPSNQPKIVIEDISTEVKTNLNSWLGSENFSRIREEIKKWIDINHQLEKIIFIQTEITEIRKLPWHLWDIIKESSNTEIVFCQDSNNPQAKPPDSKKLENLGENRPLEMLVVLGYRVDINIDKDLESLRKLPIENNINITYTGDIKDSSGKTLNFKGFSEELWQQKWDIMYFCGHTETDKYGCGVIKISEHDHILINNLSDSFSYAVERGLKLAIFNSCDGLGLANSKIPCTVIMREKIPDPVAHEFVEAFFHHYKENSSIYLSLRKAREKIGETQQKEFPCMDWLPIIMQPRPELVSLPQLIRLPKPKASIKQRLIIGFASSLLVTGVIIAARTMGLLQGFELNVFDRMMQSRSIEKQDEYITVVAVTEQDVDKELKESKQSSQSLSNKSLDKLLAKLEGYHPSVIGLDNYFNLDHRIDPKYKKLNEYLEKGELYTVCLREGKERAELAPTNALAKSISFSDIALDDDGISRRQLLGMRKASSGKYNSDDCKAEQSLSYLLANNFLDNDLLQQRNQLKLGSEAEYSFLKAGEISIDLISNRMGAYQNFNDKEFSEYQIVLNYRSSTSSKQAFNTISLHDLLEEKDNEKLKALINNKIILIGTIDTSRSGFVDSVKTPLSKGIESEKPDPYEQSNMRGIFFKPIQLVNLSMQQNKIVL